MEENWSSFLAILDQTSHLLPKKWFQFPPGCFFSITYHHIFANFELIHSVTLYINTEKSSNKNLIIQGVTRPNLLLSLSPAHIHTSIQHTSQSTHPHTRPHVPTRREATAKHASLPSAASSNFFVYTSSLSLSPLSHPLPFTHTHISSAYTRRRGDQVNGRSWMARRGLVNARGLGAARARDVRFDSRRRRRRRQERCTPSPFSTFLRRARAQRFFICEREGEEVRLRSQRGL